MDNELMIAVFSLIGTLSGSFAGILTSNRLTVYRIQQLEKKVDKHNCVIERTAVLERDIKTAFRLLDEIREEVHHEN